MTVGDVPITENKSNFSGTGLGPVVQDIHPDPGSATFPAHDMLLEATTPNVFILTGAGNDILKASAGSNVLDGGSGRQNMFFASAPNGAGHTTYIADATTASTENYIANMKAGDDVIIAGTFGSVAAGIGMTGLDFQLTGFNDAPSADVSLGNIKAEVNINLSFGLVTNSPTGQDYFFIHRTS